MNSNEMREITAKKSWLYIVALFSLIAAGFWWWIGNPAEKAPVPTVKKDNRILSEGVVVPARHAQLVMPIEGIIGGISIREGDNVKAGQPLIVLMRQDYEARIATAKSDTTRSAAILEVAQINVTGAERELDRQQRLAELGATSQYMVDKAKTELERCRAIFVQNQAEYKSQTLRLTEAEGQLLKTELRSPIDGIVVSIDAQVGEHANPGKILVRIADIEVWEVRSEDLTEVAAAKIRTGDTAALTFDALPGLTIPGKVKFVRPFGEKKRGEMTHTVIVIPDRADDRLRWNMTAQIAITPSPRD